MPWARARALAHAAPAALPARQVELGSALGLTLARPLRSLSPLPAFDSAAMDGYAVAGPGPWRLRGRTLAGDARARPLAGGEAIEVATGAPVPTGTEAVLPYEMARRRGRLLTGMVAVEQNVRRAGEDAAAGAVLAPAGARIGPALLGLAASCGHDTLAVRPRPRARVLVTGDELVFSGPSGAGRARDALGPLVPALIGEADGEAGDPRHLPDNAAALAAALEPDEGEQVVVVTGSCSSGAADHLRGALRQCGARLHVDGVACRPGHPQLLAQLDERRWLVGLPGNPYAALVAAHTLLVPLLAGLSGRPLAPLPQLPVHGPCRPLADGTRLVPVALEGGGARVIGSDGPAFLRGAALGDALAAIPPAWVPGELAPVLVTG